MDLKERLNELKKIAQYNGNMLPSEVYYEFDDNQIGDAEQFFRDNNIEVSDSLDNEDFDYSCGANDPDNEFYGEEEGYSVKYDEQFKNTDSFKLHLKDISKIPLLTPQEEKHLGNIIKNGSIEQKIKAAKKLSKSNLRLVISIVNDNYGGLPDADKKDYIAIGELALHKAAKNFDGDSGVRFSTYAVWCVKNVLKTFKREENDGFKLSRKDLDSISEMAKAEESLTASLGREPAAKEIADKMGVSEDEVNDLFDIILNRKTASLDSEQTDGNGNSYSIEDLVASGESIPDEGWENEEIEKELKKWLQRILTKNEFEVICLKQEMGEDTTETEIAEKLGKTKQTVSAQLRSAREKITSGMDEWKRIKKSIYGK